MLNPAETHGREKGFFFFFYAPALLLLLPWPLALMCVCPYVCVCVHACWEEKKNSRVNGDVTVRLWPPHESAPE